MRLLNTKFEFCDYDNTPPLYAILSHTWNEKNEEEVTYQDLRNGSCCWARTPTSTLRAENMAMRSKLPQQKPLR